LRKTADFHLAALSFYHTSVGPAVHESRLPSRVRFRAENSLGVVLAPLSPSAILQAASSQLPEQSFASGSRRLPKPAGYGNGSPRDVERDLRRLRRGSQPRLRQVVRTKPVASTIAPNPSAICLPSCEANNRGVQSQKRTRRVWTSANPRGHSRRHESDSCLRA